MCAPLFEASHLSLLYHVRDQNKCTGTSFDAYFTMAEKFDITKMSVVSSLETFLLEP